MCHTTSGVQIIWIKVTLKEEYMVNPFIELINTCGPPPASSSDGTKDNDNGSSGSNMQCVMLGVVHRLPNMPMRCLPRIEMRMWMMVILEKERREATRGVTLPLFGGYIGSQAPGEI